MTSDDFQIIPLFRTLLVQGEVRGGGEPFQGLVIAIGVSPTSGDTNYLVSDTSKPAPIWVESDDLTSQRYGGVGGG